MLRTCYVHNTCMLQDLCVRHPRFNMQACQPYLSTAALLFTPCKPARSTSSSLEAFAAQV